MKFTSAYAAAPVCTPTRVAFMTGRYPQRYEVGLQEPLTASSPPVGLPAGQPTVASRMRAAGYETALIGKWHLGWRPEFQPNRHGFDEFYGTLERRARLLHARRARCRRSVTLPDLWENDRRIDDRRLSHGCVQRPRRRVRAAAAQQAVLFELALHGAALAVGRARRSRDGRSRGSRGRADDERRLARRVCADDAQHGRRDWPRARRAAAGSARARHARDLHERQRRRTLFVQLAVLVPEALLVRGRNPRAGHRPLARRRARRRRHRPGRDHDGLGCDDARRGRARRPTPAHSTARTCCPC